MPAGAWRASFSAQDAGFLKTTWKGPISGIELDVDVIAPRGYSADDGRTYGVIEALHGFRGSPDSIIDALGSPEALQRAIDAGRIPPSIIVVPSLNVDSGEHDCANLGGRPAIATFVAQEVPRMIAATFPNVSRERAAWMVMGLSSGAYCAAWTAMTEPSQYGAAGVLSSYDRPAEGGLARSPGDRAQHPVDHAGRAHPRRAADVGARGPGRPLRRRGHCEAAAGGGPRDGLGDR